MKFALRAPVFLVAGWCGVTRRPASNEDSDEDCGRAVGTRMTEEQATEEADDSEEVGPFA